MVHLRLVGANPNAAVAGGDELPGKANYFIGNDPKKWRTNLPTYAKVKYHDVYPGVGLVYHGDQSGQLEFDFVVAPGLDPSAITLDVRAVAAATQAPPQIAADGDLVIPADGGELRFHKPVVYQEQDSGFRSQESEAKNEIRKSKSESRSPANRQSAIENRQSVEGRFLLDAQNHVHFALGPYDHTRPLLIDPVLVYSTYLGGSGNDSAVGINVDTSGNAYIVGSTDSTDFPVSATTYQKTFGGSSLCNFSWLCGDAFVTKLSADGTALLYSTYLGGSGADNGNAIAIDSSGNAYITGVTSPTNFPVTPGVFQPNCGTGCYGNAFISKLSPDGSKLLYSTYLGGSDQGFSGNFVDSASGIAVDSSGNAYVTGVAHSTDFPVTAGSFQTTMPNPVISGFVAKLNSNASSLLYSTYLGGSVEDSASTIALDNSGSAYVTGMSFSPDFPTTPRAFQVPFGTTASAVPSTSYVTKLSPDGSSLVYSSLPGGWQGQSIAVDSSGSAYVTGGAGDFFPTTSEALGTNCDTGSYITKLTPDGSGIAYSTQFCAVSGAVTLGLAIDSSGSAYVTGAVSLTSFPATANALQTAIGNVCCFSDAFLTKLTPDGSAIAYSTYLGGESSDQGNAIAVDSSGNAYLTGWTESTDFPIANPVQATYAGEYDAFISEISPPATSFSLYPAALEFGNLGVGIASTSKPVTLANLSGSALAISGVTTTAGFSQSNDCGNSLAASAQCSIEVTFNPSAAGASAGTLSVTTADGTQSVSLTGTGVNGPVVALSPYIPGINPPYPQFVNVPVGITSPPLTVTVTNIGNAQLIINELELSPGGVFDFAGSNCYEVAPLSNCTISVAYSSSGSVNGDLGGLTIYDNASDSPQGIELFGIGASAGLRFMSFGVKFANQPPSTTSTAQTVALMNGTGTQITLGDISTKGDFAQTNNCGLTLANGAYCTFNVTFTPTAAGVRQGALRVTYVGGSGPTVLALLGSSSPGQVVLASPLSLTFDDQTVGTTSSEQTVTLSNGGNFALNIASISFVGTNPEDFAQENNCGASIAAGRSCTIDVTFDPSASGTRTADLWISDSAIGSPQTVSLTGTGVNPPPTISVSPSSITLIRGGSPQSVSVGLTRNGYTGNVTLSTSTLPSGVTDTITQPGAGNSGSLRLSAASNAGLVNNQTITVIANGSGLSAVTATFTLTVSSGSTSIAVSGVNPSALTLVQGGSAQSVTINLARRNYTGSVTLSTSTLPSGVTATFTQPGTGNSGSISLSAASNATPVSDQTITVTASGSGVASVTATFTLTVSSGSASIAISSVKPSSITLVQGGSAQSVTVRLTLSNYTGSITLSTSTLPSGVTATFTQPGTGTSGSINLSAASSATLVSNQTITITASGSGVASATATFALTVDLPAPTLTAPPNTTSNVSTTPTFTWTAVTGNAGYRILVATSSSVLPTSPAVNTCAHCTIDAATATSVSSYTPGAALRPMTMYYWEVQALTPTGGYGTWSSIYSFRTR